METEHSLGFCFFSIQLPWHSWFLLLPQLWAGAVHDTKEQMTSQPRSTSDWSHLWGQVFLIPLPHFSWNPQAPMALDEVSKQRQAHSRPIRTKKRTVVIHNASANDSYNWLPRELFWSVRESTDWQQSTICHHQALMGDSLLLLQHVSFSCLQYVSFITPSGSVKASYTLLICWSGPFILQKLN